jgi:O-methyltransferase
MSVDALLSKHPLISDQIERLELATILRALESVIDKGTKGDVVEFGCYEGTASLFITRLLQELAPDRAYHVYDSFEGLPEKTAADNSPAGVQFIAGELAASKQAFMANFKKARLPLPVIHKSWFKDLTPDDIPYNIAFAFLDGDYYESIWTSLKLIESRISSGAIIAIDDYQSEALPGARKATDQWLQNKDYALVVAHSLAIIRVP